MIDLFKLCKGNLPIGWPRVKQQISVFQHKSPDAKRKVLKVIWRKNQTKPSPSKKPNTPPPQHKTHKNLLSCRIFSFSLAPLIFCFCFLFSSVRIGEYHLPSSSKQIGSVVYSCSGCFFCKNSFPFFLHA